MDKHTELAKVTAAMQQTKERRMYECCYQAIYLHLKGTSMKAIADILNRNRMTAEQLHSYVRERWTEPCKSRCLRCSYSVDEAAAGSLETNRRLFVPHEVGFTAKHNWTLELIATYGTRIMPL
ncbi:hypothetical protein P7H20_01815 [Paenibacillus larvae]|nr:hypothetical protein [Paenibacillus larvae]MDT2273886.1 hypothetical protein [Paenibacillus larvae]